MSTSIDQAFTKQFEREVHEAYQRQGSKLRATVRVKNGVRGSSTVFQKVGKGSAATKARHGKVPVMNVDHTPVEHADADAWRSMFEVNVMGVLHMCQAAIPVLRANAPGVIANVTSSSILAAVPFYAGYRGTKAAVSALCDTLRAELRPFGVRVVEILPGPVDTDMFQFTRGVGPAARDDLYRTMAEAAEERRRLHADPLVVTPAAASTSFGGGV